MKSFVLSDNMDTLIGMRLAGIDGVIIKDKEELLDNLERIIAEEEIGILIITEKILDMAESYIMELKLKRKYPLIVEIPDRSGFTRTESLTKFIRESIGVKI